MLSVTFFFSIESEPYSYLAPPFALSMVAQLSVIKIIHIKIGLIIMPTSRGFCEN